MGEFVEEPIYAQLARIGKALSSPVRLRLLDLLDQGERTVEQLADEAGVTVKNTSAQLQQLRAANLVASRKDGTRVYYRLATPEVSTFLGHFQDFAEDRLADLRSAVAAHLGDPAEMEPVTVEQLRERLDDPDLVVLDIRSPEEYAAGHVPGAVSLPSGELRDKLAELPRDAKIVAYCQGPYCVASPKAVQLLRELGYDARPLAGGFTRWDRVGRRASRSR
ncbi:transcriptional regulator, ArsR family [Streptoalloteichus tenebrarius]|uniref:Transcriptional regulator, ArsR family n=1 Tax=Streptoalloteichus tenebrarius (strain ATCC 17920 / DSM 40477 / JCM 4838 / CBS 697.72 / NBRC 16177 / NCIMB 11028 / NRRL B-12390 / A12253. 1 / ISP 5477) TaxID=1933 RepID=A0ABT1HLM3_STRSD|nr:metalloregulator ArsR/SmtB family transcription factor [Streptoalloteichus tenebrarius]MCP2256398.1 transcriptional regulator, ArsR family [Streptoalloteichus tenebrarius]BFF04746.1 metalloregulator ArsR/SmtB family transcription factor [Streptoalloteichus tenebrarius]